MLTCFFFFLFFPPFKCVFIANISDILIFSFFFPPRELSFLFFFFGETKEAFHRSKLLNDIDTFSHNFVRSIREKNGSLENESRAIFDSLRYSIGGKKFLG